MSLLHGVGDFFALDFGTTAIRLVQLSGIMRSGFTLQKYAYVPIEPSVMHDSSEFGKKKRKEIILDAVHQAGVRTKNVAIGLPARKTYTTIAEVPTQSEKDLQRTIKYSIDQYIPMAADEAEVSYALIGPHPNDPKKSEVLISSTSKSYAEVMMEMMETIGFNVVAQEPEPIAMARALNPVGSMDARMIIDFGERSTDLVVVYQGAPRLVRSMPGGLVALVKTAAQTLSVQEDQARRFILRFGLAQDKLDGQVFKSIETNLELYAGELMKSVTFFQNKYTGIPVVGIVMSGFAGVIPFFAEYIEAKTSIPTIQGNPWQLVKVTQAQQQALMGVASEFAVAIGLAERSNEQ